MSDRSKESERRMGKGAEAAKPKTSVRPEGKSAKPADERPRRAAAEHEEVAPHDDERAHGRDEGAAGYDRAEHDEGEHHGPGLGVYFGVFGALLVLTGVTVAAAFTDLGHFSALVAVGIAAVKATMVVLYFMHVRYSTRLIGLYAASGFLFVAILLGITMSEVADRRPQPDRDPLRPDAVEVEPAVVHEEAH